MSSSVYTNETLSPFVTWILKNNVFVGAPMDGLLNIV